MCPITPPQRFTGKGMASKTSVHGILCRCGSGQIPQATPRSLPGSGMPSHFGQVVCGHLPFTHYDCEQLLSGTQCCGHLSDLTPHLVTCGWAFFNARGILKEAQAVLRAAACTRTFERCSCMNFRDTTGAILVNAHSNTIQNTARAPSRARGTNPEPLRALRRYTPRLRRVSGANLQPFSK